VIGGNVKIRILSVILTLCAIVLACRILSVYTPIAKAQKAPVVAVRFSGEQAMQRLDSLTHRFKGRVVGSRQGFAAADYVAQEFRSYGLNVDMQDFREPGAMAERSQWGWFNGRNVIGLLKGREQGTVVLTAHRDCVPRAPEGAYDNGSGTAIIMELARALAAGGAHQYSYAFAALDGEEIGFAGARALMNNLPASLKDIRLMINLDMLGFKGRPQLALAHTQYLPPELRSLTANRFSIPQYSLLQFPIGRGTDAQLYVLRGFATLDIREYMPTFTKVENHNAGDTYDQISVDSIQQAGQAVEQLILQGDAMGIFTPSEGLAVFNGAGVLAHWRYILGGICILAAFLIPMLFRFRSASHGGKPGMIMAIMILLTGISTALSALWAGSGAFVMIPFCSLIIFLALQAVAMRLTKNPDSGMGHFLLAAAPPLLFAGTWILTGLWSLGLWLAVLAYFPAVLATWKPGWGWRFIDTVLILPSLLFTWLVALAAWLLAPTHAFPSAKLAFFTAIYAAAALIGIWGVFGRRPPRPALTAPSGNVIDELGPPPHTA
jgi:hypothetical protein